MKIIKNLTEQDKRKILKTKQRLCNAANYLHNSLQFVINKKQIKLF